MHEAASHSNMFYKHSAAIFRDGFPKVIGVNYINPLQIRALQAVEPDYKAVHAEADLAMKCHFSQKLFRNCTVVLYGARKERRIYSKPCPLCQGLLQRLRVREVFFFTPDGIELWCPTGRTR